MDCCPEPDEALLGRYPVSFATGTAASVDGRRSFRDRRRHDIEPALPGWPEGSSTFSVRRLPGKIGLYVRVAVSAPFTIAWAILCDLLGGGTTDPEPGRGRPEERENEVDDFPVMWADPCDTARALPWQLDPSRRPPRCATEIVLTPGRLFVVESGRTLWETPRDNVAEATVKQFSLGRRDFRLSFQDGSWARLTTRLSTHTTELVELLNGGTVPERGQSPTAQP